MFGLESIPTISHEVSSRGAHGPFSDGNAALSDADIRAALAKRGFGSGVGAGVILEEVEFFRGYVRADYVCCASNALSVVEIKSDRDNLRRFDEQIRIYSAVADRVTLVVGWNLAAHALRAAPLWWDVILAERDRSFDVQLVPLRDGMQNPAMTVEALVAMLPIDDVHRLASAKMDSLSRLRGRELCRAVAEHHSRVEVLAAVQKWLARLSQLRNSDAS